MTPMRHEDHDIRPLQPRQGSNSQQLYVMGFPCIHAIAKSQGYLQIALKIEVVDILEDECSRTFYYCQKH